MLYSSRNGTLFYYDRVLYTWQIAEPTMLFLLGLESVTAYDNALSDSLVISNSVYVKDQNDLIPFEHFKIYDKIHSYLSQLSSIEDLEYYLKFNCNGLKLLLNELTGTGTDRTVPLIFKNDVNNKSIDLNSTLFRLTSDTSATLYDRQAQKIIDIFSDAGWSGGDLIDISDIDPENQFLISYLKALNLTLSEQYAERRSNGQIYKLLDYRSMYSYALGVLYGCRCMGFSPILIWRIDPKFWYNGDYVNLVNTAWHVFRFHHTCYIEELDESSDTTLSDKYKGITPNRLWNFGSEPEIDCSNLQGAPLPLHASELNCYALYVNETYEDNDWNVTQPALIGEKAVAEPIIYSQFTNNSASVLSAYLYYAYLNINKNCFVITALGDSLPESGSYSFKIIITDTSDLNSIENATEIQRTNSSKDLFIFSDVDDDLELYTYLSRFNSDDPTISISVVVSINDDYTSDEIELFKWDDLKVPGHYLYMNPSGTDISWVDNVDSKISTQPDTGIVAANSTPIVRYLADDPIVIHKAYKWLDHLTLRYMDDNGVSSVREIRPPEYLSPYRDQDDIYFIATGNIGWTYFDEDLYKDNSGEFPYMLSMVPYSKLNTDELREKVLPTDISLSHDVKPIGYARYRVDNSIVTYYRCIASDSDHNHKKSPNDTYIYGIFDGNVNIIKDPDNDKLTYDYSTLINYSSKNSAVGFFKSFISKDLFESCYETLSLISGYTLSNWYNITIPVSIFIKDDDNTLMYIGTEEAVPISNYGYTPKKAVAISAYEYQEDYIDSETERVIPKPYDLRYYSGYDAYWSINWRAWRQKSNIDNIYKIDGDTQVYRGQTLIYYNTRAYSKISDDGYKYIFNDSSLIQYAAQGFVQIKPADRDQTIETLWKYGYTTHVCTFIFKDDNGHYLTDDATSSGTPLVWYDQETEMYWNGLADIRRWQTVKPLLNSQFVYITTQGQFSQAIDDTAHQIISIDGADYIPYSEFYSDNTRGVVRYRLQVFNTDRASEGIIDCLVDDKNDPDHPENAIYCIPGVTPTWVSRSQILPEFGYRFVDGMASLYTGVSKVDVVVDDDFID